MTDSSEGLSQLLRARARELGRSVQNALEVLRLGSAGSPTRTPYTVLRNERVFSLRRYAAQPGRPKVEHPILLVPSLVASADLYDLAPELSAIQVLTRQGIDTWLCDFSPPDVDGTGHTRTQDDYVHALDECIELIREQTGKEVHLCAHSQGGMLAYQVAALRRGEGLKSLIALGVPVDLHQNTALDPDLFARGLELLREGTLGSLRRIDSLPSTALDLAFRLVNLEHSVRARLGGAPHDEEDSAARKQVSSQRAFVSWPGPALSKFTDELLLSNRLMQGGFLITGKVCSLSDLSVPLLYFVAERDDIARPRAVRAIQRAAPQLNELYEVSVATGHVGLLAGKRAFETTWPTIVAWLRWREGGGPKPAALFGQDRKGYVNQALAELTDGIGLLRDASSGVARTVSRSVANATRESLKLSESLRYQVARLAKLEQLTAATRISFGLTLAERAEKNPDGAWFMYEGRGQSYREANHRVDHVVRGLIACGIRPSQHVGVLMDNRPSYLSLVTALSRLGAVAVLLSPHSERASLQQALSLSPIDALVADPENVARARDSYPGKLLMLGAPKAPRPELPNVVDMESIDTDGVALPEWYRPNPGFADELAMIMFTAGPNDAPHATRITNRKWAVAAYSAAAFAALGPKDTVYACTPLHHASAMLVAVGGAMAGNARLALSTRFSAERFWPEVRRYGVSVVIYSGDVLRELVHAPSYRGEQYNPIRLFAGSGMRADTQRKLMQRFGDAKVLEFYASAEGPGMLVNVSGKKIGAFGRAPNHGEHLFVAAYDFTQDRFLRDENGMCIEAGDDEPGVLLTLVDKSQARAAYDGYADNERRDDQLVRDVRKPNDSWFVTGDVMRRDPQRDHWPLDRLNDVIHTSHGLAFTRPIEDVLYELPDVRMVAVSASQAARGHQQPEATLVLYKREALPVELLTRLATLHLSPHERPRTVRCVQKMPLSDGNRPLKAELAAAAVSEPASALYIYDENSLSYRVAPSASIAESAALS